MRIVKFLITSFLIFLVVGSATFVIGREALLWWGVSSIQSALSEVRYLSKNAKDYILQCRQKGAVDTTDAIDHFQLRFVDDRNFTVEVVCTNFPLDPINVERKTLPMLVRKVPGSSGVIWGEERGGVELEVLGRRRDIFVEQREVVVAAPGSNLGAAMPLTSCQGYGFQCCQSETVMGTGASYEGVSDCPKTCYSQCVARPVILSFTADPFPEGNSRFVSVMAGESVTFSYVASTPDNKKGSAPLVVIQYGDGTQEEERKLNGSFSHQYTCLDGTLSSPCRYIVTITAQDSKGIQSAATAVTTFTVTVNP